MACFSPISAWQCSNGDVVFSQLSRYDIVRSIELPCSRCIGCRLERSRQWAMRCVHESKMHAENCFVTLTYDDEHLPHRGVLRYEDFQLFMKRLRKEFSPKRIRFYMCGEYGSLDWRPHYHACLFGLDFSDKYYWSTAPSGARIYRSVQLEKLWPDGHSTVGALTFESAAYVARYCVQKVTGDLAEVHYARKDADGAYSLPPEFNHMSLKPGIGARYVEKWKGDIYNFDRVVVNGVQCAVPRYYDKWLKRTDRERLEELKYEREVEGRKLNADSTVARLAVREEVVRARVRNLKRSMNNDS